MTEHNGKHFESCQEIFAQLSAYLDEDLPPDACREIDEHLAGCPPCVEFVASLRRTLELYRGYKPSEKPDPLDDATRHRLREAYRKMLAARHAPPETGSL